MLKNPRTAEILAIGAIFGLVALGLAFVNKKPKGGAVVAARGVQALEGGTSRFGIQEDGTRVVVESRVSAFRRDAALSLLVDGTPRPLALASGALKTGEPGVRRAPLTIPIGDDALEAEVLFKVDVAADALTIELRAKPVRAREPHTVALRVELPTDAQSTAFLSGTGEVGETPSVTGPILVVDSQPRPVGVVSSAGPLTVSASPDNAGEAPEQLRVSAASPARTFPNPTPGGPEAQVTDLRLVLGESSAKIWRALYAAAGTPTLKVRGAVTGTSDLARVYGRDSQGLPQVFARTVVGNKVELDVPAMVVEWYAVVDAARASSLYSFAPGSDKELVLDVSPGGELKVVIVDADTHKPLTARLMVRGVEGTIDPSFGPDYRASGAGPLIDALRGEVATPLPAGKYRVAASKGIEWSVDSKVVTIAAGHTVEVSLAPRHVVPTPNLVGCDLHLHARPSFDSPVSPEDRVLSLVSAGVDFAVPTEHNLVGDYSSAVETLDVAREFAWISGVEITTFSPGVGHFGVFPYPIGTKPPPYRGGGLGHIIQNARGGDPRRMLQIHHPRLPKGIGYFNIAGYNPKSPRLPRGMRLDFDSIEVMNGFDMERPERIDQVLADYWGLLNHGYRFGATGSSDSHRIQFQWAGYPRTMVAVDTPPDGRLDPLAVVAALKKGRIQTVSTGPIIELDVGGAKPGEELKTEADPLKARVRVRAAPWVDVTRIEIVVGGQKVQTLPVPGRPTKVGDEEGTIEEAAQRTLRFDQEVTFTVGPENGWVQVIARGDRRMDDVLPHMPVPPYAFTNPVYIVRKPVPPPPAAIPMDTAPKPKPSGP